jgi:Flp pilus assembly protein TadG
VDVEVDMGCARFIGVMRHRLDAAHRDALAFRRSEDGGMIFFSMIILLIMLFVGGMAVDLMRYEAERSRIQAVADASALAAASIRQTRTPDDVVTDWFAKANLSESLVNVDDQVGMNFRSVRAETRTVTRPYFMHMLGVDELRSNAAGSAEERRTNVEISLVLDVSGSMNSGSRASNLRTAAKDFIDKILRDDTENRVSISIVPYNGQVMLGTELFSRHTVTHQHSLPNTSTPRRCIDLPDNAYDTSIPVSRTTGYAQSAYADTFQWAYDETYYTNTPSFYTHPQGPDNTVIWCTGRTDNRIRPFSNDRLGLMAAIDNLEFTGATSIDLGMKWGATLLDPASQPMISQIAGGVVPTYFGTRPVAYTDQETLKVIVLMTDGEHFVMQQLKNEYRSGLSPIWRRWDSGVGAWRYVIHHPTRSGSNKFWAPHMNSGAGQWVASASSIGSGVTQMDWRDLWRDVRMKWVAWQLYARAWGGTSGSLRTTEFNKAMNMFREEVSIDDMDARLLNLCGQVKAQNVLVFGIAFEAPDRGTNLIRNCASPNRFYDVNGSDLTAAFSSIRVQISALRLTQ